jgi:hypothetical protein
MNAPDEKLICLKLDTARAYVNGSISVNNRFVVEEHLIECHYCSSVISAIKSNELEMLQEETQILRESLKLPKNHVKSLAISFVGVPLYQKIIALGVLLIFIFFIIAIRYQSGTNEIFRQYYSLDDLDRNAFYASPGNPNPQINEFEKTILINIRSRNYTQALLNCREGQPQYLDSGSANFWEGICYLEMNDLTNAFKKLYEVRKTRHAKLLPATWYLSLAYIKNEEWTLARLLLQELTETGDPEFVRRSERLLDEILNHKPI